MNQNINQHLEVAHAELQSRYHLVSSAISAEVVQSPRYLQFTQLLKDMFLPFANRVNVLANEAEAIIRLKAVEDQVRLVESLSRFKNKTVVAVSGGFSSGKSSFISSLFSDKNIQLPIGVQPITAIPTYVFHSEQNQIVGYSAHGGEVNIPADIYAQLSHEFVQEFGFNLRDLLPFIALETPIEHYENLSFIDLPGYNPGDREGFTGHDESSASEYMTQAQCILWVIGLDANGTISRADIDFLLDHVPPGVRLYVILNKADLKPLSDVQKVMQEVADMLFMDGVEFEGISAYSSEWQEELAFEQQSLHDILSEWNQPKDTYHVLVEEVDQIFIEYKQAFLADIKNRKAKTALLKALELDLYELGAFDDGIQAEPFDMSAYRSKPKTKKNNKKPKNTTADKLSSLLQMLGENEEGEDDEAEETTSQLDRQTNQPDSQEQRMDKIMLIKQHLSELRLDYAVKYREAELDELMSLWNAFREALSAGPYQDVERKESTDKAPDIANPPIITASESVDEPQTLDTRSEMKNKEQETQENIDKHAQLLSMLSSLSTRTFG
ncbi:dynamin family protein [Oceanisphaera sp.]|uniref:dynamin family protein n=1 Tax=Oceanisphaera sp. TaxID=1929979 RepID=UPI003A8D2EA6